MTNGGEQPQYYIFGGNQPEQQKSGTSQYFPFNNKLSYQNNNSNSNEYKDSSISDIEGFLKAFLKAINKNKNKDEDYLKAGERTCNSYIAKIKNYGNKTEELEPLINLQKEITKDDDLFDTIKRCTNNIQKINIVAKKIDDAENEVLQRIKKNKTIKESERIAKESEKIQGKKMFETMNDGSLVFTEASNPVKIHEALKGLFKNPKIVYQIDYSNIDTSDKNGTGQHIKNKVLELTGTTKCWLSYDQETNTYVLRESEHGEPIKDYRARIRNGVKLIPEGVRQRQSHEETQQINRNEYNNLGVTLQSQQSTQLNSMLNTIPSAKEKLTADEQKQLMQKTETRILKLLKKAKQLGYEIDSQEPISKVWFGNGHMELHLKDSLTSSDISRTIWENKDTENIGEKIYDFIDKNEGDYKKYLTTIVHQKRAELESLTKRNKIDLSGEDILNEEEVKQLLYGMSTFKDTVEIERNSSSANFRVKIYNLLEDGIYSVENSSTISKSKVFENIIDKLWNIYANGKNLSPKLTKEEEEWDFGFQGTNRENGLYTQKKNNFYGMFFGGNDKQRQVMRNISEKGIGDTDKTSSSHVENDIIEESFEKDANGIYKNKFQVKNEKENNCVNNIYNYDISLDQRLFDETGNLTKEGKNKVNSIDDLYEAAASYNTNPNMNDKNSFIRYVVRKGLLPDYSSAWNSSHYESQIVDAAIKLKNKLNSIKKQIDNFPTTAKDLAEADHKEKLILEQKENKTEEEIKKLQVLEYLENNPSEQNRINEITINMMKSELKYGGFAQGLASCLFEPLADFGGGAVGGIDANIFNDITGAGLRNLSDANAVIASQIVVEIIITVIVAVATCGAGAAITAGALRLGVGAARLGKAARWVKLANNIEKIIRLNNLGMKGFRLANTVGKISMLTTHATSLLIEATAFNTASELIHSAINGTSLDNITRTLNPITRENIQTAAFLGVLSINSQIAGKVLQQGGATRLQIDLEKGLEAANKSRPEVFTAQLVSEMTSMLAAEQTINFVFGHDVINPKTGEIERSRSLEWPTGQEWIQMIGMILAFKAVKPGIWAKYAQRINSGTIKLCRLKEGKGVVLVEEKTGKVLETINEESINGRGTQGGRPSKTEKGKVSNDRVRNKAIEELNSEFDSQIWSEQGITIDGITYKLERHPNETGNRTRKGDIVYKEIGPDGKVIDSKTRSVNSESPEIPDGSNGNRIRELVEGVRRKYTEKNIDAFVARTMQNTQTELSRNLEESRRNKETLEGQRKELTNEIEGLNKRLTQLEQQLQTIQKEIIEQPQTVSLKDILNVFFTRAGKSVSIGGIKCEFVKVENGKIYFTKFKKPFSSFKELKDAGIRFDIDINVKQERNRTEKTYEKQQQIFDELVRAEEKAAEIARNANNIIREYKELSNKRDQIKSELETNSYFRENAHKLAGEKVWINGTEYKISLTEEGLLRFVEAKGQGDFTISSFKELANKGQVNGFSDGVRSRYNGKEIIREKIEGSGSLKPHEKEIHELLYGEEGNPNKPGLIKGEDNYINSRKQDLQDINELLEIGKADYENAVASTTPRKVTNPEYERVQKEIDGIDSQIKSKTEDLSKVEKDLGTSETEIVAIEKEINELTTERDKLSEDNKGNNKKEQEEQKRKQQEEKEKQRQEEQERKQKEEQERKQKEEQERKQEKEQEKKQREEQQRRQREEKLSNEVTNEIKNKIPDLLKREQRSSISSEFSNNPELHQNFIKTKVLKNLINYVENITKSGKNPDLIEVLKGSKEELNNISYEQRIELINNINSYLKSVETASRFINIEKSGGVSAKELFLRAKGLDTSEINNFEGNVTIEQFRNSIVFVFEKASDVQRFFGQNGNGNHFENKIPGLDTIVINKENCKNAEKIGLKEGDAISRVLQHESQHAINEIFMPKDVKITYEEAMDPVLTDINTVKKYALDRVKDEIIAQYTNRLIIKNLSTETISILSKGGGIKELLTTEGNTYDYFKKRRNTPEEKKAREEYKREVEKMCDYVDETLKSCKSNEEIQNMLNMFCTTDVKERKNIKDSFKTREQQRRQKEEEQKEQIEGEKENTENKSEDKVSERVEISNKNDNWYTEQLNKYKIGEVFELTYNTQQGQVREIYIKDKDGYFRAKEKDGKYVKTEEKLTEQQMIEKMRSRNTLISEIITSGNIEQESYGKIKIGNKEFNIQEENGKKFVEINGEKYYEYKNDISGLGYEICAEYSYIGNYKNGKVEGRGTVYTNRYKYEGEFKNGLENGKGTKSFTSGDKYEGEFKDGKYNGQGKYTWADGSRYEGEFKNDMFDGKGIEKDAKGNIKYEGEYKNDIFNGKGKEYKDGKIYEGEFIDGYMKNGIEISNNGRIKKVKFVGDVGKDFIIREMKLIEEKIGIGDSITIGLQDGTILEIQNINGDLIEIVQCRGNHQILNPIEKGKLGEYVNRRMEDITVYYEVVVDQLERFLKKHEIINEHGIRTHEEGTMRELQKKLEGYSSEELNEIVEHSTGDVQHQAYRILEIRQNGSAGSNVVSTTPELNQIFEDFGNFEVNNYATLNADGKFSFKSECISKDFRGKKYATINGKKYRIFENGKGKGFGCMLGSRGGASRGWGGEYDIQIGNFKNGVLEGEGIRITKGFREEGIFKNGQLEGNGKVYKNNHLLYEGEFKNGVYNGKGKEYDANGTIVYEGEFKNGSRLNKAPEVSNKRINTERKEMSDVYRETDVVAIGDLHGAYEALKGNMEFAGLAKEVNGHLEWTGGNKKVVFQGDILADRGTDGLRIIQEIHQLREQARKQGGDIDIIVGNHDDFMISYLTNRNGIHGDGYNIAYSYEMQGKGLVEILKYIGIKPTGEAGDFGYLKGRNVEILNSMRNSKEGRIILEEICNMKVVTQVDDILYCHTNPTKKMLEYLTNGNVQDNINLINNNYQGYLKSVLLGEGTPPIDTGGFNKISDIFLDTNNRHGMMGGIEQYCNKLKNSGINMISHGHNGGTGYRSTEIGGVKIVDTDHTFMKKGEYGDGHSVSIVKKEGGVNYIGDNVAYANIAYANIEYPIGTEVYVKRSAGGESKAKVDSYDPTTKMYKVIWKEGGKILSKEVMSEDLRGVDSQINIAA